MTLTNQINNMLLKCPKCEQIAFQVIINKECLPECIYNGCYDDDADEYVYTNHELGDEAAENSSCKMGCNYNNGCYLFYCLNCQENVEFLPLAGDC